MDIVGFTIGIHSQEITCFYLTSQFSNKKKKIVKECSAIEMTLWFYLSQHYDKISMSRSLFGRYNLAAHVHIVVNI